MYSELDRATRQKIIDGLKRSGEYRDRDQSGLKELVGVGEWQPAELQVVRIDEPIERWAVVARRHFLSIPTRIRTRGG